MHIFFKEEELQEKSQQTIKVTKEHEYRVHIGKKLVAKLHSNNKKIRECNESYVPHPPKT